METPSPILPIIPSFISVQTSPTTKEGSRSMIYNNGVFCSLMEKEPTRTKGTGRTVTAGLGYAGISTSGRGQIGFWNSQKYSFRSQKFF